MLRTEVSETTSLTRLGISTQKKEETFDVRAVFPTKPTKGGFSLVPLLHADPTSVQFKTDDDWYRIPYSQLAIDNHDIRSNRFTVQFP